VLPTSMRLECPGCAWGSFSAYCLRHEWLSEGRRVEAVIEGTGTPAVVFERGFNGPSPWEPIQSQIAQKTATLSYMRAGLGHSDPGPNPRSAEQIANELHA
jgi:hypothetical protein